MDAPCRAEPHLPPRLFQHSKVLFQRVPPTGTWGVSQQVVHKKNMSLKPDGIQGSHFGCSRCLCEVTIKDLTREKARNKTCCFSGTAAGPWLSRCGGTNPQSEQGHEVGCIAWRTPCGSVWQGWFPRSEAPSAQLKNHRVRGMNHVCGHRLITYAA